MNTGQKLFVLAVGLLMLAPAALAGPATFSTIDYPGAAKTFANGINAGGDIVGSFVDSAGHEHGYVLRDGLFTVINYPGAAWTQAWGINPQGAIVGQYAFGDKLIHGFLLVGDNFFPIDLELAGESNVNTMPAKISPAGTIAGCVHVSNAAGGTIMDKMYGFVLNAEGVTLTLARTMHNGVNPEGDLVGNYADPATNAFRMSYVISNGETTWFTFPGSSITRAWDISATGDVVGFYKLGTLFHGFLLRHGVMDSIDVDLPGVTDTRPYGINPQGDIVGYYADSHGIHGFLLSRRTP